MMMKKTLMLITMILATMLIISFFPEIIGKQKEYDEQKISFLKKKAHDGNISAAYKLAHYYVYKDKKQAKAWVQIVHKIQIKRENRVKISDDANATKSPTLHPLQSPPVLQ